MKLRINQGTVSLGGNIILDHIDLEIRGKERIALVGVNGSGKTTLLHLIAGQLPLDTDDKRFEAGIWIARNTTIGILEQNPSFPGDQTLDDLIEEICPVEDPYSKERYDFETEYHKIFTMFGFDMSHRRKKVREFSGGEQTKIALIRLLLMKPDILLLDEPTNHLDMETTHWLENYLRQYENAVIVVSHDRFFLDQVATVVYELDSGKTKRYAGNYSNYRKEREQELQSLRKRYDHQQEEIKRLNEVIEKFKHKPKKASMARSKKKVLERMEKIESPDSIRSYIYPGQIIPERPGSKWVYDCQKMVIGYDQPLQEINLRMKRGQKIGIIGSNGIGKTTFLKTLMGMIPPLKGHIYPGNNLDLAYFDQLTSQITGDQRLLEDFQKKHPSYTLGDCRKILAKFLFQKDEISKTIDNLSGGEKVRYAFANIFEDKPNLLLLDEPTNHLDIPSREILESAFAQYQGSILFITHDRYFLDQVADALLIFEKNKVTYYPDGYRKYMESLEKEILRKKQGIGSIEEENQRLCMSLEQVPEKKRIQSARFNEDQSFTDWQLGLMGEELERLSTLYHNIWSTIPFFDCRLCDIYHSELGLEDWPAIKKEMAVFEAQYEEACKQWYEKWMEYEDAFADYHDA